MKYKGVLNYQATGWMVFNFYGLDTQISNRIDIYNDRVSGEKKLAGQNFRFIKTNKKRLGYTKDLNVEPNSIEIMKISVRFGSLARVVFDAIYDYDKFGSLPIAFEWLEEKAIDRKFLNEFIEICLKLGNVSTMRRVGFILEQMGCSAVFTSKMSHRLKATSAFIPLNPIRPARGKINKKWGLIVNQ
ncbi:MAG: hypothetical protein HY072_04225 [Deltaproteobacteria bacterium]|nr:hypothetical protein [Deltaproteobacteria bacterium]